MGIYDRDYYRDQPRGVFLSTQSGVYLLIFANVAVFIVDFFARNWLKSNLSLGTDVFQTWQLWELVTHGFLHGDLFHLLFNMLALWWFGQEVETIYGRKRFLQLYFYLLVMAGLGWVGAETLGARNFSAHAVGASGAISGILIVYVLHYPFRLIYIWGVIPVPAWLMATIWIGQDLFLLTGRMHFPNELDGAVGIPRVAYAAHLVGAAFGAIFFYRQWTPFDLVSFRWWGRLTARRLKNPLASKGRPKLRIVEPDDEPEENLEAEVDRILAKISAHGTGSLTAEEQHTLQKAAQRAKQKLGS